MNQIFVARTKEALKSLIALKGLNKDDYVFVSVTDNLRQNKVLKSIVPQIEDRAFTNMMVLKDFVTVSGDASVKLNVPALKESTDCEVNKEDKKSVGEKFVKEGVLKSLLEKISNAKVFTEEEKALLLSTVKSAGVTDTKHSTSADKKDEFVSGSEQKDLGEDAEPELKDCHAKEEESEERTKSMEGKEPEKDEEPKEDKAEKEEPRPVTKSLSSYFVEENEEAQVKALLKSCNSLSTDEPVFRSKNDARSFALKYNTTVSDGSKRAVLYGPTQADTRKYGTKVKARVNFQ